MKVARGVLLAVLEAASPALGTSRNLVPGLSHFWFDGNSVVAFNDVLGIRIPFVSDFTGGVEGERLLGLLKHSNSRHVTLETSSTGRTLTVELGSAEVLLPVLPVSELLFDEEFPNGRVLVVSDKFIESLKLVMLSCVSKKLASAAERGVTLVQSDTDTDLFTTDELTVSWARVEKCSPFRSPTTDRATWPREFCDYFIKHFSKGANVATTDDAVWCTGDVEQMSVTVYAKLIEDSSPAEFPSFIRRHEGELGFAFTIPSDFTHALSRAMAMVPEKTPIELEVTADGDVRVLRLFAKSAVGEFEDLIEVNGASGHNVKVKADAALIRRALPNRTALALTREMVVLTGPPGFFHFISTKR